MYATAAARVVAVVVHLVTAGLLLGGLTLLLGAWHRGVLVVPGLALLASGFALCPRPGRLRSELPVVREPDAPELFRLVHDVAHAVGVRRIDLVQLTPECSVTVARYGLLRTPCLLLGLPLWAAHLPQQRVAALAHALAHLSPHHVRHGALIGTALDSLAVGPGRVRTSPEARLPYGSLAQAWRAGDIVEAERHFNARGRRGDLASWAVLWIPRAVASATRRLLVRLTRSATQRAEAEAELATARTASSDAAVAVLDRHLARATALEMHRLVVEARTFGGRRSATASREDLWVKLARHATRVRADQDASRRAGQDRSLSAPCHTAAVTLDASRRRRIAAELRDPQREVALMVLRDGIPEPAGFEA
ncbi:hypothetical protein ABZ733_22290 [Streptomyces longwoodensis]|uniref:hypothetical protein n=1 Tax=Streptomyces longwoodensis TaxID=68231 RepID=UPI0033C8877D